MKRQITGRERLTRWMNDKGLSYREAEVITGVSSANLQKIATGRLRITEESARKLAEHVIPSKHLNLDQRRKKWHTLVMPAEGGE